MLLLSMLTVVCGGGYQQGDCDPGYLEVDGNCELAVGQTCEGGGDCLSGICVDKEDQKGFCTIGCDNDLNCPAGFFCDSRNGDRCYPGKRPDPCMGDEDCLPCQQCSEGYCFTMPLCVTCLQDEDCQACQRCDESECIDVSGCHRCQSDTDCPACEDCAENGQCARRSGCILCASGGDCPGCMTCERESCTEIEGCGTDPCFNDSDCPERTRCLFNNLLQFQTCLPVNLPFGADCQRGGDPTCAGGLCIELDDGSMACSHPCESDLECPDFTVCLPDDNCLWACREPYTPPPGEECLSDFDCRESARVCGLVPDETNALWRSRCLVALSCVGLPGDDCPPEEGSACTTGVCSRRGYCTPVCAGDLDCPVGFLCGQIGLTLPQGQTAFFSGCDPEIFVAGETGEPCQPGSGQCGKGICLEHGPGGPGPFCSLDCDPGEADCPDRFACLEDSLQSGIFRCQPSLAGGECQTNADCSPGQICTLSTNSDMTICTQPAIDGAQTGEPCGQGTACANGLCLASGVCSKLCSGSLDCPSEWICDYHDAIGPGGDRSFFKLCTPEPGSRSPCKLDTDCDARESCRAVLNAAGSGLDGRCSTTGSGAPTGESCSMGADCLNGFCPDSGACTNLCLSDADCPEMFACRWTTVSMWPGASFGIHACQEIVFSELGEPCIEGELDCVDGLVCFQPPIGGDKYCSKECFNNEDCQEVDGMLCLGDGSGGAFCQIL